MLNQKSFKIKFLDKLLSRYKKFVEYYEMISDPICHYFIEKIHLVMQKKLKFNTQFENQGLQTEDIDNMVVKNRDTLTEMKEFARQTTCKRFNNMSDKKVINEDSDRETFIKENRKPKDLEIQMRVEQKLNSAKKNKDIIAKIAQTQKQVLKNYEEISKHNDSILRNDLLAQEENLRKKIEERQNASFSRSINRSMVNGKNGKR